MNTESDKSFETSRLILRPFACSDLNDLFALNSDKETMKYISPPLSKEQVSSVIDWFINGWERLGYGWFAVFEKESGDFVGQCGLQCLEGKQDSGEVELAFVISKNHWGRGYATEAAQAVVVFGMNHAELNQIAAVTMKENIKLYGRTVM